PAPLERAELGVLRRDADVGEQRRLAAGGETAVLAESRIAAEDAEFGALERRWNIVGGDGLTARLPLVVGFAKALELIITGRRVDAREAERIGLVNEV